MGANVLRYASHVQVFLVRHAEAAADGQLSPRGRDQACALRDRMRWYDCSPTRVWSSPLVRAIQTAELVAPEPRIEIVDALVPDGDAHEMVAALRALAHDDAVLLVGHEPSLSTIGAVLVGDPTFAGLARAQAVRIIDGRLRWRFSWDEDAPS
jgi:phosphohistidine phosphatase SixA